jgi:hypothetical protein
VRFSWSYPLFDDLSLPRLAPARCDQNHGILVSDEAFLRLSRTSPVLPLGRMAANVAKLPELLRRKDDSP